MKRSRVATPRGNISLEQISSKYLMKIYRHDLSFPKKKHYFRFAPSRLPPLFGEIDYSGNSSQQDCACMLSCVLYGGTMVKRKQEPAWRSVTARLLYFLDRGSHSLLGGTSPCVPAKANPLPVRHFRSIGTA